ncbi:hypothetical protein BYT27DRAFT_7196804 [Phlegmacium glaucopus]|nr:hypothetical protein BYT27DRAFT_7196804 [Phlegmacium glaucopus]
MNIHSRITRTGWILLMGLAPNTYYGQLTILACFIRCNYDRMKDFVGNFQSSDLRYDACSERRLNVVQGRIPVLLIMQCVAKSCRLFDPSEIPNLCNRDELSG